MSRVRAQGPLLLVIAAAFIIPKVVVLRGLEVSSTFGFEDMPAYLMQLDSITKQRFLPLEALEDTYLRANREFSFPWRPIQWTRGVYDAACLWAWLFGTASPWMTLLTNLVFSVVLAIGVLGLARHLGVASLGSVGVLLCLLCPPLASVTLYFTLDFPLVAMTTVGLLLLLETQGFRRPAPCLSFGAWCALGMYVKPTYGLYLAGPCLWILGAALVRGPRPRLKPAAFFGAVVLFSAILTVLLIEPDWSELAHQARVHLLTDSLPGAKLKAFTWAWISANAAFIVGHFPFPLLLVVVPGLVVAHRRGGLPVERLLVAFVWCTYVTLTLLANKMARYALPLYPVLCLLSAWGVVRLTPRRWQKAGLAALVAAFVVTHWLAYEYSTPWFTRVAKEHKRGKGGPPAPPSDGFHPLLQGLGMPDRRVLESLRRNRWDPSCELEPLFRHIRAWIPARSTRPVAFACLEGPMEEHPHMLLMRMVPGILRHFPDRVVVIPHVHCIDNISATLLQAPYLVVMLTVKTDPAMFLPTGRIARRVRVHFPCGETPYELQLLLLRNGPK